MGFSFHFAPHSIFYYTFLFNAIVFLKFFYKFVIILLHDKKSLDFCAKAPKPRL